MYQQTEGTGSDEYNSDRNRFSAPFEQEMLKGTHREWIVVYISLLFVSGLFTPANRSGYLPQSEFTKDKRSLTNTRVRRNNTHVRNNEADDIIITDSEADDIIITDTATGTLYVNRTTPY